MAIPIGPLATWEVCVYISRNEKIDCELMSSIGILAFTCNLSLMDIEARQSIISMHRKGGTEVKHE